MTVIQSIILGGIQGITEFLPISSSAHLILVPWFFHFDDGNINKLTYDVMLHFGTLLAILAIYGRRFAGLILEGLSDIRQGRFLDAMIVKIAVATIPAVICGLAFKDTIEETLRSPLVIVFTLIGVSVLMFVAERAHGPGRKITYTVAIIIGIAQAIALIPGTSRSGITITAGIFFGLKREEAVDFSFLMAIPIILGAALHEARHVQFNNGDLTLYATGMISAFVFGFLSLKFLIGYLKKHSLDLFAYYRCALALVILLFS